LHSLDLAVAAQSSVPVLISGPTERALPTAIEIAVGTGENGADGVMVVDAGDDRYFRSTMVRASSSDFGRLRALVIHGVDALDDAQQAAVMTLVAKLSARRASGCRLITTTAVSLFDRVVEGRFDADLFYRLNEIHITTGDAWAAGDASSWRRTH